MADKITVQPLPLKHRNRTFYLLVTLFLLVLPFLYLYATGYRFDFKKPTQLISTGGLYLAVERTGAEIYIDDELVRETRTFRRAFYAQNIDTGTHRVHVQKEGYHTWVKELPVSKHLVTEAQAFNLPLVPQVRVVAPWQTATGTQVMHAPLLSASTTNAVLVSTSTATSSLVRNTEYASLFARFMPATTTPATTVSGRTPSTTASTSVSSATSTVIGNGVQLTMVGEDLYATWVGSFETMPYYYCAEDFPRYSTSTPTSTIIAPEEAEEVDQTPNDDGFFMHPLQTLAPNTPCEPTIKIDRQWQTIHDFDFYPGSSDLVLVALDTGIYAVEIDDRAWQNVQPVLLGEHLSMLLDNGNLFVYDGSLIYQVLLNADITPVQEAVEDVIS